ncbi:MAG: M20/M25/M40 family metallo-hydrolase [Bryobacterales bacterium]
MGDGAKTVIPAKALAKVSMRLVPDMDPAEAAQGLVDRVAAVCPKGMKVETRILAQSPASLASTDNVFVRKASEALEETFGKHAVYVRSGGSIPVVGLFAKHAGIPSVLMGFGLPDDNLHAPNEKFHVPNFYKGIEAVGRYLARLGD